MSRILYYDNSLSGVEKYEFCKFDQYRTLRTVANITQQNTFTFVSLTDAMHNALWLGLRLRLNHQANVVSSFFSIG